METELVTAAEAVPVGTLLETSGLCAMVAEITYPLSAYLEAFSETHIPVRFPTAAPNLQPRDDIWPTERAPVIRQIEERLGVCAAAMGLSRLRGREGRPDHQFPLGRAALSQGSLLGPRGSHFFEFTGSKSPKSKWKFTMAGQDWFCFAGLWRPVVRRGGRLRSRCSRATRPGRCPDP